MGKDAGMQPFLFLVNCSIFTSTFLVFLFRVIPYHTMCHTTSYNILYTSSRRKFGQMKSRDWQKQREEKSRREQIREEKESQKKEDADAQKGRKVAKHCLFPLMCDSGGSKSRLAKAAGAEPSGQMRDEKWHTVVTRSTFRSQNVQSTPASDHFL